MTESLHQFLNLKAPLLFEKILQQFDLVLWSLLIALLIALPLGVLIYRTSRLKHFVLSSVSALWTIPSLALLAFFIPVFGIGVTPAIIVLSIYALLPILRNTVTGLSGVSAESLEAAMGLGFTRMQQLRMVEFPLAMPVIIAGIRTAVSMSVGVATLAAFIGAGGLGDFINQGLALNSTRLILLGAIPAAIMALILDVIIAQIEKIMADIVVTKRKRRIRVFLIYFLMVFLVLMLGRHLIIDGFIVKKGRGKVVIATKNFTESFILGDLMADMIRNKTHLKVIEKFNLGSTAICQAAMVRGDIDIYPEYTGTAYIIVLKKHYEVPALKGANNSVQEKEKIYNAVKTEYKKQFNITWLKPFGFNNTEALAVKRVFAKKHHLKKISDLVPIEDQLTIGVPAGFKERPDGFIGLKRVYGLNFRSIKQMDPGLMYRAILKGSVNVIAAFSTDGRIPAYHLVILKDDKALYPSYYAAPLIRESVLKKHPQIATALKPLFGIINNQTMQKLNYEVDVNNLSPEVVAHRFLVNRGLVKG